MSKSFLRQFSLPSAEAENRFLSRELKSTCYTGVYPFKLFPHRGLSSLELAPVTIFCGGNGSGKSTLLNLIAEKAGVNRRTPFSSGAFFGRYLRDCSLEGSAPRGSCILTSDDVSDALLNLRFLNNGVDLRREELMEEFLDRKYAHSQLRSLSDYEDWRESCDAKSGSQSRFVRDRLAQNAVMRSNGESALAFFLETIREDAVYLLDEPENSLSAAHQEVLRDFLRDSARFFGCQILLATHSPILLSLEDALIYDLDACPVRTRPWTELPCVRRYFDFFEAHRAEFLCSS